MAGVPTQDSHIGRRPHLPHEPDARATRRAPQSCTRRPITTPSAGRNLPPALHRECASVLRLIAHEPATAARQTIVTACAPAVASGPAQRHARRQACAAQSALASPNAGPIMLRVGREGAEEGRGGCGEWNAGAGGGGASGVVVRWCWWGRVGGRRGVNTIVDTRSSGNRPPSTARGASALSAPPGHGCASRSVSHGHVREDAGNTSSRRTNCERRPGSVHRLAMAMRCLALFGRESGATTTPL